MPGCILKAHRPTTTPTRCGIEHGEHTGHDEAGAARAQADDEVGPGIETDHGDEAGQPDRLEHPQRRTRDAAEEAWRHRAQPSADQAAEQHADAQAQSDLDASEHQGGDANQCAADNPESNEDHVSHVGGAVCHADPVHGLREPAGRADESQDVAAVHHGAGKDWHRRPGARDAPQVDAARGILISQIGNRAPVEVRSGDDHVQRLCRDIEQFPVVDFADFQRLLIHRRDDELSPTGDRQRIARQHGRRLIGVEDLVATPDSFDEEPCVFHALLELADMSPDQGRSRQHDISSILDVPPRP